MIEMNKIRVTKAKLTDAEMIVNFLNLVGGETDFLTFGENEFPISIDEESKLINELLLSDRSLMLVGKIKEDIVSQLFLDVSLQPRLSHIGYLGLTVKKNYWGMSIGKQMLMKAILWAREKHLTKIQLQVRVDNFNAVNLYKKFAFVIEGKISHSLKVNDIFYDEYIMGLNL